MVEFLSFNDVFDHKWTPEMFRIVFRLILDEFLVFLGVSVGFLCFWMQRRTARRLCTETDAFAHVTCTSALPWGASALRHALLCSLVVPQWPVGL